MRTLKVALVVATIGGPALVAGAGVPSAMPIDGLVAASSELAGDVQNVRWCGRYRCGWRPRAYVYPPVFYGYPRVYYVWPYYPPFWEVGWAMGRGI
jgi:hypothetical protein